MIGILKSIVGVDREGPIEVLKFYSRISASHKFLTAFLMLLGFTARALKVLVFVVMLKVFLIILDPTVVLKMVNDFIANVYSLPALESDTFMVIVVAILGFLILLQFLLNLLYSKVFIYTRTKLQRRLLVASFCADEKLHLNICLDRFPNGFDAFVKSAEILLFFFILLAGISFLSPLSGLLVVLVVPVIVLLMLYLSRKDVHFIAEYHDVRRDIRMRKDEGIEECIRKSEKVFLSDRGALVYSDFLSGLAVVSLILFLMHFSPEGHTHLSGLATLILVFGIRFAIVFSGELSRALSRLFQQRVFISKIDTDWSF